MTSMDGPSIQRGPLYLNTRTDRIVSGTWSTEPLSDPEGAECVLSSESPSQPPRGRTGFALRGDTSVPGGGWESLGRFEAGVDPGRAEAWLVDPTRYSLLDWMDAFDRPRKRVLLDLRDVNHPSLYHTWNVRGWIQQEPVAPTVYHPQREPCGTAGKGPVFVLVHGFTGDPINWEPVRRRLERGPWPYVVPLLPGHGQSRNRLAETSWEAWSDTVRHVATNLREQDRPLVGLGLSMGGLLLKHNHQLFDAVVSINSPWSLHDWRALLLPFIKLFKQYHFSGNGGKVIPVSAIHELDKLIRSVRGKLDSVTVPTLILNNRDDDVIPPADGDRYVNRLRHAERGYLETGGHESPGDPDVTDALMTQIGKWLDRTGLDVPELSNL